MKKMLVSFVLPVSFAIHALPEAKIAKKADQAVAVVKSNAGKIATALTLGAVAGIIAYDNKEAIAQTAMAIVQNPRTSIATIVKGVAAVPGVASAYCGAVAVKELFAGTDGGFRLFAAVPLTGLCGWVSMMIYGLGLALEDKEIS